MFSEFGKKLDLAEDLSGLSFSYPRQDYIYME
jgi:hypothetical protein